MWVDKELTISIVGADENNPPTEITLSNTVLKAGSSGGTIVGSFATEDQDVGDTFSYILSAGIGDTDNGKFSIAEDELSVATEISEGSYSIRVRSSDGEASVERTFNISATGASTSAVLSSGATVSDYRIFGVPTSSINVSDFFPELLSTAQGTSWRLTSYFNGRTSDLGASSTLSGGRGYWLLSRESVTTNDSNFSPLPLNAASEFEMTLNSGWNLISNPFLINLEWDDFIPFNISEGVISSTDVTSSGFYTYNGAYNISSSLKPFEGAWIFSTKNVILRLPNPASSSSGRRSGISSFPVEYSWFEDQYNWQLVLQIKSSSTISNLPGIGMRVDASDQVDHYDLKSPPLISPEAAFSLNDEYSLARNIVSPGLEKQWTFKTMASGHDEVIISWDPSIVERLPQNMYIHISEWNRAFNMQAISEISVPVTSTLRLTLGKGVDRSTLDFNATAYPNPVDNEVSFKFFVDGPKKAYNVKVFIYGVDGQMLYHRSAIKPSGEWGSIYIADLDLSPGLYFYEINYDSRSSPLNKLLIK